jgi:Carboxypeptidase regulatory-like domain
VADATITITNPQTNFTRMTHSNEVGNYSFPVLPPGLYEVQVEKPGFQNEHRRSIELQVQGRQVSISG